jgi:hypothetical protein
MAHHYPEYIGPTGSPFKNPASFWGLEKPVLIGEFPARDWPAGYTAQYSMTVKDAFEYAYDNGYCGAMSWSMTEGNTAKFGNYSTTKPALENLFSKHQSDILVIKGGVTPSSSSISSSSISSSSAAVSSSSNRSSSSVATTTSSSSNRSSSSAATTTSSSSSNKSSSSSLEEQPPSISSSSDSEVSPILNSQVPILNSNPTYYTIQGKPLGLTKPNKPGVYIVKEGHSIKKIVVR